MTTYAQVSALQLQYLCSALGLSARVREYLTVQAALMEPWGSRPLPALAPYPSQIGDDHSPYEYSVQFSRQAVELRLLVEAQATVPNLRNNQLAAQALSARLRSKFGVDATRLGPVEELFLPQDPHGPFSLWHAACFDSAGQPAFKVYLNPRVNGAGTASGVFSEAAGRLGLSRAALPVIEHVERLGGVPNYFSLDLSERLGARAKLYFSHMDATHAELEAVFALAPSNIAGDVTAFCRAIVGEAARLTKKPVCYCFSFVDGIDHAVSVTFHLPVAHYLESDALILHHVSTFMSQHGLQVAQYQRAVTALARRALGMSVGLQSYASFRRERSGLKLTVYFSPELFSAPYAHYPFAFEGANLGSTE
ncbi:MAG: tryptophan dimethylallyltransferase family protein [Polyangiaceae bacterium]